MKTKNLIKIKFLLTLLVLSGALLVGVNLVSQNQENRSKAFFNNEYQSDGGNKLDYKKGNWPYPGWSPSGESKCVAIGGICAKFSSIWPEGTPCLVGKKNGYIKKESLCSGDNYVLCCSPKKPCNIKGNVYPDGTTFCNGVSRVYICDNGNQVYRGLDCSRLGKICIKGKCVNKTGY